MEATELDAKTRLMDQLEGSGVDQSRWAELMWFLNAPESLHGLMWAALRAKKVLHCISSGQNKSNQSQGAAEKFLHVVDILCEEIKNLKKPGDLVAASAHNFKRSNPAYALLMHKPCHVKNHDKIYSFVCLYSLIGFHERKNAGIKLTTLYKGCEAGWALFDGDGPEDILDQVAKNLPKNMSREILIDRFEKNKPEASEDGRGTQINHISQLRRLMSGKGRSRKSSERSDGERSPSQHHGERGSLYELKIAFDDPLVFEDMPSEGESATFYPTMEDDDSYGHDMVVMLRPRLPGFDIRYSKQLERARYHHQASILNAKVTSKWEHLTALEHESIKSYCLSTSDQVFEKLILALAFGYGWGAGEQAQILLAADAPLLPEKIYALVSDKKFMVPGMLPKRKTVDQEHKHFSLPMIEPVHTLLQAYVEANPGSSLIKKPDTTISETLNVCLKRIQGARKIPAVRVANTLTHVGESLGVDSVLLSNLCQRKPAGCLSQPHYTRISHDQILGSFDLIQQRLGFGHYTLMTPTEDLFGDVKAITLSEAQALFRQAIEHLKTLQLRGTMMDRYINARSLILFMALQFGCGLRAHSKSDIYLEDLEDQLGLLGVNDKRSLKENSLRFIYVPKAIRTLIGRYLGQKQCWVNVTQLMYEKEFEDLPRFVCRSGARIYPLQPLAIKSLVDTSKDIRDIGRHFFRSEMVKAGCPAELINAQMGHWTIGREPFGSTSTLSPREFSNKIAPFVEKIATDLGIDNVTSYF